MKEIDYCRKLNLFIISFSFYVNILSGINLFSANLSEHLQLEKNEHCFEMVLRNIALKKGNNNDY